MFVWPVPGGDQGILRFLEGKLARMTQGVPTIRIERVLVLMQELVVGIPPTWIRLLRKVTRVIIFYR